MISLNKDDAKEMSIDLMEIQPRRWFNVDKMMLQIESGQNFNKLCVVQGSMLLLPLHA